VHFLDGAFADIAELQDAYGSLRDTAARSTRAVMSSTDDPMRSNASRV
jgi:hypothetical protein